MLKGLTIMFNTEKAKDLIYILIREITSRFRGNDFLTGMTIMPLMHFDQGHIEPMTNGTYTGTREGYFSAVRKLMLHLQTGLNNIYDDQYLQLGELLDEKGVEHNLERNNTLQEHALIFLNVWPHDEEE